MYTTNGRQAKEYIENSLANRRYWKVEKKQILLVNMQNPDDREYFVQQLKCRKCQKSDGVKHSLERKSSELQESINIKNCVLVQYYIG